ncbi:helix-turn-helix domain-containing protein [Bibersteinia trehalosi]|uniref:helix-turn-helix domain-containing protein n=1 Tax=Bibersteinia trehalosi TaxID=47735 RepID=UPI003D275869
MFGSIATVCSFTRYFKNATNLTLSEWLTAKRLAKVQELLESSDDSIETIAQRSGFGTASNLRTQFKARFGGNPQVWRRGERLKMCRFENNFAYIILFSL